MKGIFYAILITGGGFAMFFLGFYAARYPFDHHPIPAAIRVEATQPSYEPQAIKYQYAQQAPVNVQYVPETELCRIIEHEQFLRSGPTGTNRIAIIERNSNELVRVNLDPDSRKGKPALEPIPPEAKYVLVTWAASTSEFEVAGWIPITPK